MKTSTTSIVQTISDLDVTKMDLKVPLCSAELSHGVGAASIASPSEKFPP